MPEFEANQQLQAKLHDIGHLRRQVITDASYSDAIVNPRIRTSDGEINLALANNLAMDVADKSDAGLMVILHADSILLDDPVMPPRAYTLTWTYRSTREEADAGQFGFDDPARQAQWGGGSWWVLRRECFKFRFWEAFIGRHGAGIDFHHNVLQPAVGHGSHWSPRAMHVAHKPRPFNEPRAESNMVLLARRFISVHGGKAITNGEHLGKEFIGMIKACRHLKALA